MNTSENHAPDLLLCEHGWEAALCEQTRLLSGATANLVAPGWLERRLPPQVEPPSAAEPFSWQLLPRAERLTAPSISRWSQQAVDRIIPALRGHEGPWRLHVFSHFAPLDRSGRRRAELVEQGLLARLKEKQRRLLRSRHVGASPLWRSDEALVQLGLMTPTDGYFSVISRGGLPPLRRAVSRFPSGVACVPTDSEAPSRAFGKLAEVELRLDRMIAPGETCVDLGSSPGSWAWWALRRGAAVVAIDRSPLREDLMRHPRLRFEQGDAFKFMPPAPVDWLLSDVIAFPARIMELLSAWLAARRCRRFCVTVKFRGTDEYPVVAELRSLLEREDVDYCLRRLTHNRNEITAYGIVRELLPHDSVGC